MVRGIIGSYLRKHRSLRCPLPTPRVDVIGVQLGGMGCGWSPELAGNRMDQAILGCCRMAQSEAEFRHHQGGKPEKQGPE